jgi:hypothetical protein
MMYPIFTTSRSDGRCKANSVLDTVGLEPKTCRYIPGLHLYSTFPIFIYCHECLAIRTVFLHTLVLNYFGWKARSFNAESCQLTMNFILGSDGVAYVAEPKLVMPWDVTVYIPC